MSLFKGKPIPYCKLISPYNNSTQCSLTPEEWNEYKSRWSIETLFKNIKSIYSESKLNLRGKYNRQLKEAKFFATCILYNMGITTPI